MKYLRILILTVVVFLLRFDIKIAAILLILLYLFRKLRFEVLTALFIGTLLIVTATIKTKQVISEGDYLFRTEIINVVNNNLVIKYNGVRILIYTSEDFQPGDIIIVKGKVLIPNGSDIENSFNYRNYLLSKGITNVMYDPVISKERGGFNLNIVPYRIKQLFKINSRSQTYIDALIFGDKLSTDIANNVQNLGINHMFAISGLHINIIASGLGVLLIKITGKKQDRFVSGFLVFYMLLTNFSVSVVRASLLFIVPSLFPKKEICNLSILSILALVLLVYNPFIIFNNAFVFSFFVSFVLVLSTSITTSKNQFKKIFYPLITIYFFTLPLMCYYSYEINLLSIINNLVFGFIVMCLILPLCFIVIIFPYFIYIFEVVMDGFNIILELATIFNFKINVGKPNIFFIFIYYLVLINYCIAIEIDAYKKRLNFDVCIVTLLLLFSVHIQIGSEVTFISVGQADSIFIRSNLNSCNALIDLGESTKSNNLEDKIVPFLKSKGVRKLDTVIITHDHYDHYGQYKRLNEFITYNTMYTNIYSKLNIRNKLKTGDIVKCGKLKLEVLSPTFNVSTNSNSLVIYLKLNGVGFLFTGDIEYDAEKYLVLNKYKVDVLKVSHHGSPTSTTEQLLKQINPKVAVLSTGLNYYGHPDKIILNRLSNYGMKCYDTNVDGSIKIVTLSNKYKITNYKKK